MKTHTPTLPESHDYAGAADKLQVSFDALESIEWRLRTIADTHENDEQLEPPSLADVGALWAFAADVDRLISQLATKRDELRRELAAINLMRLEGAETHGR
jgi:hypothetical protein